MFSLGASWIQIVFTQALEYRIDITFKQFPFVVNSKFLREILCAFAYNSAYGSPYMLLCFPLGIIIIKSILDRIFCIKPFAVIPFNNSNYICISIKICVYVAHLLSSYTMSFMFPAKTYLLLLEDTLYDPAIIYKHHYHLIIHYKCISSTLLTSSLSSILFRNVNDCVLLHNPNNIPN